MNGRQRLIQVKWKKIVNFSRSLDIDLNVQQGKTDTRISDAFAEFKHRYPMLKMLNYSSFNSSFNVVNDYINIVDMSWVYFELSRPMPTVEEDD